VIYLLQYNTGPHCGQAGQVLVSPKDGGAQSCDGRALGGPIVPNSKAGAVVYNANCASCHLANGAGQDQGGVGRPLWTQGSSTLTDDFPDLRNQVTFVQGGSAKNPIYGAKGRKAGSVAMPAFGTQLSDFDLVSAVAYERQVLHGVSPDDPSETLPEPYCGDNCAAASAGALTSTAASR
jgi:cytochrome c5